MTFFVGQKVVCIWNEFTHPLAHLVKTFPRKGEIYHVRGFAPIVSPLANERYEYLWLVEVVNGLVEGHEPSFAHIAFRPVVEKKTDISIFTALLNTKQRERESVE